MRAFYFRRGVLIRIPDAGTGCVACLVRAHAAGHESIYTPNSSRLAAENFVLAIQSPLSQAQQPYDDATYTRKAWPIRISLLYMNDPKKSPIHTSFLGLPQLL